jgi:hypothetical protein
VSAAHADETYVGVDSRASSPAPLVLPIAAGDSQFVLELLSVKWLEIGFMETRAFANFGGRASGGANQIDRP